MFILEIVGNTKHGYNFLEGQGGGGYGLTEFSFLSFGDKSLGGQVVGSVKSLSSGGVKNKIKIFEKLFSFLKNQKKSYLF